MPMQKFGLVADARRDEGRVRIVAPEPLTEADLWRAHSNAFAANGL